MTWMEETHQSASFLEDYGVEISYVMYGKTRRRIPGFLRGMVLRRRRRRQQTSSPRSGVPSSSSSSSSSSNDDDDDNNRNVDYFPPIFIQSMIPGDLDVNYKQYDVSTMRVDTEIWILLQSTHQKLIERTKFWIHIAFLCVSILLTIVIHYMDRHMLDEYLRRRRRRTSQGGNEEEALNMVHSSPFDDGNRNSDYYFPPIFIKPMLPGDLDVNYKQYDASTMRVDPETWSLLQSTHQKLIMRSDLFLNFGSFAFCMLLLIGTHHIRDFVQEYSYSIIHLAFVLFMLYGVDKVTVCEEVARLVNQGLLENVNQAHLAVEFLTSDLSGRDPKDCRRYQFVRREIPSIM